MNLLLSLLIVTQYYGQNKVQYRDFDYKIFTTEHFDIYYYPGGEDLAAFAEDVLEDAYRRYSEDLGVEVDFRIPVILYDSPNDFSQTNVTLQLVEESVGGFTEILKNRMVIPFSGDYDDFRHVLAHELVHVFQFTIFFPSKLEALVSGDIFYSIPLWVMEGMAEFESINWDEEADIFMRDMVMNNNVVSLNALGNYGGYIVYKEGQAFYYYVAEKYGRQKVGEFVHMLKNKKNLEATFVSVFGVTVDDFNKRWLRFYQLRYWPKIGLQENFDDFARIVYDHKKTNTLYNTSPAISPNGDKIAFISDRTGVAEIVIISSIDGRVLRRLVRSEYASGYEGLHLYQGGLTWSPDEKYIAFAAKSRGEDVLYILNSRNGRLYKRFALKLDGIYSPTFAPDGKRIMFSGMKDSYLDIYVIDIASGHCEKITDDIYADKYPVMNERGSVLFVSDRPDSSEDYQYGAYALFLSGDGRFGRLTPRAGYVASPFLAAVDIAGADSGSQADSGIFFIADYDSAYNLYYYSFAAQQITRRTDILTGIYYPSISADGKKIAFSYFNNFGYDICVVKEPFDKMTDTQVKDTLESEYSYEEIELDQDRIRNYRPHFTFDYFTASASYYSPLGLSGMSEIGLSDILGNHQIALAANIYGSLTDSDIYLRYWYLKKRTDFGLAAFQYLNYFAQNNDLIIWRYLGGGGMAQYPLDRFIRLEFGVYAYKVLERRWLDFFPYYVSDVYEDTSYTFFYPSLALVFDNAKWGDTGPNDGHRVRLEGYTTVLSDFDIKSVVLDYRRYFRLTPRASLAARLVLAGSFADTVDIWSMGGAGSLRGFDYYAFNSTKLGFFNFEYRFPFIDRLKIAFPLPMEIMSIRGALFADLGGVYSDSFRVYEWDSGLKLKDVYMGVGGGLRFYFLYTIFKLDMARATNLKSWIDENDRRSSWKFYLTLGSEW
jgi:WD40 repeat protein